MEYVFGYLFGVLIVSIICGAISKGISSSRGMDGGFGWGFWLWIIGIIVVAVRPNDRSSSSAYSSSTSSYSSSSSAYSGNNRAKNEREPIPYGGWRCPKCGKARYGYEFSCTCGATKYTVPEKEIKPFIADNSAKEIETLPTQPSNVEETKSMPAPLEEKTESDSSAFGICVVPAIDDTPTVAGDADAEQEILPTDPVLDEDIKELQALEEDIEERSAPMEEKAKSSADTSEVFLYMIEIRKLKELLDEGILTQEEFDAKKKQLLGI